MLQILTPILSKTLNACFTLCHDLRWLVYQNWFDLESLSFTWTSIPTHSTATLDMTSLATSGFRKKTSKMSPQTTLGLIFPEGFQRVSRNFSFLLQIISFTNLLNMTSQAAFCWLQDAVKYCTKVRETSGAGKESNNSGTV